MKYLFPLILLLTLSLNAQLVETTSNQNDYYKTCSSNLSFIEKNINTKNFIKKLDSNILSYIKSNTLEREIFDFFYDGGYQNLRYLSHYLKEKINSKSLNLTLKDKYRICNIIKKYNKESPQGDNCLGNIFYSDSKLKFWNYLPYYISAYIKYLKSGINYQLYFYSIAYFILFFSLLVLFISFIRTLPLFLKDLHTVIYLKRPEKESFLWVMSFLFFSLYLLITYKPILLATVILALSASYFPKKFLPLFALLAIIPVALKFSEQKFSIYKTEISQKDKIALELIYTDMLPTSKQIKTLKKSNTFFSYVALGAFYKRKNHKDLALKYYKKALKIKKEPFITNNIANIYALKKDYQKALTLYNEIKYNKDESIYYYNISKVYCRLKDKERSDYYRKLAKNTDKKSLKLFDKISTFNLNRFFMDKYPKYKELLQLYKTLNKTKEKKENHFCLNLQTYTVYLVISFIIYIFTLIFFRRKFKAEYCQRCSAVFNTKDITEKYKNFNLCASCYSMMNTRTTLKKEDLIKKEKEIRIRKKIKKYIDSAVNLIFPGAFLFYKRLSYLGTILLFWQSFYLITVLYFYDKWKMTVNIHFFNFSMTFFLLIEILLYFFTYLKLIKR